MEEKKRSELKSVFDEKVKEVSVACNSALLVAEKYAEHIACIERIKAGAKKVANDYRMLRTYDVLLVDGTKKLIYPVSSSSATSVMYYVTADELLDMYF